MSYFVPPSMRKDEEEGVDGAADDVTSPDFQRKLFEALGQTIRGVVNRVAGDNVADCAVLLFRENLVRGRGLLARSLMRTQQMNPDLTPVLAALVSRINAELPDVIFLLCKRLVVQWTRARLRRDWNTVSCVSRFLCWLYIFQVVDVSVIYQIIIVHLTSEKRTDEDIEQASAVFRETFKCMSQRARAEFHQQVLTPFRDLLAMDDPEARLSARGQAVLESCLKDVQKWEKAKLRENVIPPELVLVDLDTTTTHELDLDEKYAAEDALDRFTFDPEYAAHEEAYEQVRQAVLGPEWETEMLQQVAEAEEEDQALFETGSDDDGEEGGAATGENGRRGDATSRDDVPPRQRVKREESGGDARPTTSAAAPDSAAAVLAAQRAESDAKKKALAVSEAERELRKKVYLAMRESIRADEAAHKILRSMKAGTEPTVCFMIVEGCCQETSYKKIYGMTAERLCKTNARYQALFLDVFREKYLGADDLTEKQIEYTSKIFVHLLRTDSVYWSRCLGVLDAVNNTVSQRIFLKNLLKGLTEDMGASAVTARFARDRELREQTTRLFPVDADAATLRRTIDLFNAMEVGYLAEPLHEALEKEQTDIAGPAAPSRKRVREG